MPILDSEVEKKRKKLPFRFDYYFPSLARQKWQKVYNFTFDTLYPIKPWAFGSLVAIFSAYFQSNDNRKWLPINTQSKPINSLILGLSTAAIPLFFLRLFLHLFLFRYKRFLFEEKPSILSKFWGLCFWVLRRFSPPRLRSCDAFLPKQPVPNLKSTVEKYLQSMEFLMSEEEFKKLRQDSQQFLAEEGPKLQRQTWLYSWTVRNYVTPFWEKYAYLNSRDNLIVNSSICCVDTLGAPKCSQPRRGAHIVYGSALNMLSFADKSQKPLADGLIFSGHYNRLYCNSRVPGIGHDSWNPKDYTRHFVCFVNGCFYKVDLFDPKTDRLYNVEELTEILTELLKRNDVATESEQKLAALTQDNRDSWAINREKFFLENEINRKFLEVIETAMVFLVLDESDNYGYEDGNNEQLANFIKNMLTGNGKNRWTDKPINFIIGKNGRAGACSEHSVADGPEYFHITENKFFADLFIGFPKEVVNLNTLTDFKPKSHLKLAERLSLDIFDEMKPEIERCYESASQLINDTDMGSIVFSEWGKGRIKKCKCSPDAFVQMAIQLAYYKDQGHLTLTYEASSSRFFDYSRTETMRTVSKESYKFVESMLNDNVDRKNSANLLIDACKWHQHRTRLAMTGKGIDRHLFVLYVLSRGNNLDSPFLNHFIQQPWKLSTTQIGYVTDLLDEDGEENKDQCWLGGSFGATTKDGYGVAYRFMGNHSIVFHITSYHSASNTSSSRFRDRVIDAMREMIQLFD